MSGNNNDFFMGNTNAFNDGDEDEDEGTITAPFQIKIEQGWQEPNKIRLITVGMPDAFEDIDYELEIVAGPQERLMRIMAHLVGDITTQNRRLEDGEIIDLKPMGWKGRRGIFKLFEIDDAKVMRLIISDQNSELDPEKIDDAWAYQFDKFEPRMPGRMEQKKSPLLERFKKFYDENKDDPKYKDAIDHLASNQKYFDQLGHAELREWIFPLMLALSITQKVLHRVLIDKGVITEEDLKGIETDAMRKQVAELFNDAAQFQIQLRTGDYDGKGLIDEHHKRESGVDKSDAEKSNSALHSTGSDKLDDSGK